MKIEVLVYGPVLGVHVITDRFTAEMRGLPVAGDLLHFEADPPRVLTVTSRTLVFNKWKRLQTAQLHCNDLMSALKTLGAPR